MKKEMPLGKKCKAEQAVKNGFVAGKQRYKCKECGCNFREGDNRTNETIQAKKALCVLFYAEAKSSYRALGRILKMNHTQVYKWIKECGEYLPEPKVPGSIKEMEFDEMWHFVGSKKTNFRPSRPLTVVQGTPWPGYSAAVILQHSEDSTIKLST